MRALQRLIRALTSKIQEIIIGRIAKINGDAFIGAERVYASRVG